jgi:hypothetical protein
MPDCPDQATMEQYDMDEPKLGTQKKTLLLAAPHGLEGIVASFGNIYDYIQPGGSLDSRWQADCLASVELPFPLPLSWDLSKSVRRMTCHKRMVEIFASVFGLVQARGLQPEISSFGGCFAFRQQRTGAKLSTHSWGIAIGLNPETNVQGSPGNMDARLIEIFRGAGFEWGGNWPGRNQDAMHFQFCSGY